MTPQLRREQILVSVLYLKVRYRFCQAAFAIRLCFALYSGFEW